MIVDTVSTPLGNVFLLSDGTALNGLYFEDQRFFPSLEGIPEGEDDITRLCRSWLSSYFEGWDPSVPFPVRTAGTPFREKVWKRLREIPYGETVSYGALASELNTSARAVGGAVGHNPVSLLIPCHRVTGADGSLTGYAGGIQRKQALLELERSSHGKRDREG